MNENTSPKKPSPNSSFTNVERVKKNQRSITSYQNLRNLTNNMHEVNKKTESTFTSSEYCIQEENAVLNQSQSNMYLNQVNNMLLKVNKMKEELDAMQEKEKQYAQKLARMEKENRSLQAQMNEKDKLILELTSKIKMSSITRHNTTSTDAETTTANLETKGTVHEYSVGDRAESGGFGRPDSSGLKFMVNKGLQVTLDSKGCSTCGFYSQQCDWLTERVCEVEKASKELIDKYNKIKKQVEGHKKTEEQFLKDYGAIESHLNKFEKEINSKNEINNELKAELTAYRKFFQQAIFENKTALPTGYFQKYSGQKNARNEQNRLQPRKMKAIHPVPAFLKAISVSEKYNHCR